MKFVPAVVAALEATLEAENARLTQENAMLRTNLHVIGLAHETLQAQVIELGKAQERAQLRVKGTS